jgi:hypothetical protein
MRVMTLGQAAAFMRDELGMEVSEAWVRKQSEPDAGGKRGLPLFRLTPGERAPLYTTDIALIAHFMELTEMALSEMYGRPKIAANLLHVQNRTLSDIEELQGVQDRTLAAKPPRWRR